MAAFTNAIGIDLGSENITISLGGEGVVLREPDCVLTEAADDEDIIAVGKEARAMLGRMPGDVVLVSPVIDGAVTDEYIAGQIITALSEKALGKRRPFERSRICLTMSPGTTKVERAALMRVLRGLGVRAAYAVRTPVAAAIGAGMDISQAKGQLIVVMGGSVTEIAILSYNGIVAFRSMRMGSHALDEAIVRYIRKEKGLIIGMRTAEDLKCDLADCSLELDTTIEAEEVTLRGRDAVSGKPSTATVTAKEITAATRKPLEDIIEAVRDAIANTPPELVGDITETGMWLSGGGAQLAGLSDLLGNLTGLEIHMSETPQDDTANGACRIAGDNAMINAFIRSSSITEI